jgi:hypothetical protein
MIEFGWLTIPKLNDDAYKAVYVIIRMRPLPRCNVDAVLVQRYVTGCARIRFTIAAGDGYPGGAYHKTKAVFDV